jgi:hypothetical protein
MYDLKKVIEANTVDGVIDYEKVMGNVDSDYVNPIVARKTDKSKLLPEAVTEVINGLGIEGANSVEDLKLYVKKLGGSTDEAKEANLKLELDFKSLQGKYDVEVENRTNLEKEAKTTNQFKLIKELGVEDKDNQEFLHFKLSKLVTDDKDFSTVVAEYAKENDVKTTTRFVKDDFGQSTSGTDDVGAAWKANRAKQGHKKKQQ